MKLGIIGGGASGLIIASYLKRKNINIDITIFDRNKSLGRKILASGNGKCNFANFKALPSDYNNPDFIKKLFDKIKKEDLINYLSSLGLMFYFDSEGRMYPTSNSSETIVSLFTNDLKDTKVLLNYTVKSVTYKNKKYYIDNEEFDYVVLASGSNSSVDLSKVDSTYSYLKDLDIKLSRLLPSLVGYKLIDKDIAILKGYRSKSNVKLFDESNNLKFIENGEVIFKEDGISGIVILNSSHYYNDSDYLILDLLYNVDKNELRYKIDSRKTYYKDPSIYLNTLFHPTLIKYLIKKNIVESNQIIDFLSNFKLDIKSTYDFKESQVTRGGILICELNNNLSLKKYPNIFACGELLDINGVCGGYNLMFAFISGLFIAKRIEEIYENKNN